MNHRLRSVLSAAPLLCAAACGPHASSGGVTPDASTPGTDDGLTDTPAVDVTPPSADAGAMDALTDAGAVTSPDGALLPNLVPRLASPQVQDNFHADPCEIDETCATAATHRVLRFDLFTPNAGPGDLYLGSPTAANRPDSGFEYSTCHHHYHLRGYAEYALVDAAGNVIANGHKQSFCLEDTARDPTFSAMGIGHDIPAGSRWGCSNQGIHAGWYDLYYRSLACQFIDITGVPAGSYRIRARVNTMHVLAETDYDDNEAFLDVTIPADPNPDGGPPPVDAGATRDAGTDTGPTVSMDPTLACGHGETGAARDCGWTTDPIRTCTPGSSMIVGCNDTCATPIGRCVGNAVVRVCEGHGACAHDAALGGAHHDACDTHCARVSFSCPGSGMYTVMWGASDPSAGAVECHLDAAPE